MREVTRVIKVFEYDELSDKAKQEVLSDTLCNINFYDTWWEDDGLLEMSQKELYDRNISSKEASKQMFEWEGIHFDIERDNFIQFKNLEVSNEGLFRKFLKLRGNTFSLMDFSFTGIQYTAGANTKLLINRKDEEKFSRYQLDVLNRAIDIFNDKVSQALKDIKSNAEYRSSEKGIKEAIEANEYEFMEDGSLYHKEENDV